MITSETVGDVTVLRLGHGKVNALDVELLDALATSMDDVSGTARAVVLTGNGRVFCAGVDLTRVLDGGAEYAGRLIPALHRAFMAVFTYPRPVVAAIDGAAIAGGCIIAAACDHRLMADGPARIGATELLVGVPFPVAPIEIMQHACGHRTGELVLRARQLDVAEAVAVGLVHRALPPERLVDEAISVAAELGELPEQAYAMAKHRLQAASVERIERDAPTVDPEVAAIWGSETTARRIADQLARLRASRA
jgi:enoyl-CoA hydratase